MPKKSYARKSSRRRTGPSRKLRRDVAALKRTLKDTIEHKIVNWNDGADNIIADRPHCVDLIQMPGADGVEADERVGDKVTYTHLSVKLYFKNLSSQYILRILIVQWPNVPTPSAHSSDLEYFLTLGEYNPISNTFTQPVQSVLMSGYKQKPTTPYKVLYDRTVTTRTYNATSVNQDGHDKMMNITLVGKKRKKTLTSTFSSGVATIPIQDCIRMYVFSNKPYNDDYDAGPPPSGSQDNTHLMYNIRSRYIDL